MLVDLALVDVIVREAVRQDAGYHGRPFQRASRLAWPDAKPAHGTTSLLAWMRQRLFSASSPARRSTSAPSTVACCSAA